jgi:hypothetical protein
MRDLPLVGDEFAGYRLLSVLGRGGMSTVYRAENPRLGNVIALKVMAPDLADNDIFRARFLEESRIAARLNHPNVVPIHDSGSSDGALYIAMRYVVGTDMRQMLKKRGWLAPETAVYLLSQAARALDTAHRRGLVHRDVKPGNLLVEQTSDDADPDHVYLTDFGITKQAMERTGLTATGQYMGTVDYISPEQIRGTPVGGQADQYSLGCVLYECLTGRLPFERDLTAAVIWAHVEAQPTRPTQLRQDLPPAVDDVFARVLAKQPGDRYRDCREFMAAAGEALGALAAPRPPADRSPGGAGPDQYSFRAPAASGEHPPYPAGPGSPPAYEPLSQSGYTQDTARAAAGGRAAPTGTNPGLREWAPQEQPERPADSLPGLEVLAGAGAPGGAPPPGRPPRAGRRRGRGLSRGGAIGAGSLAVVAVVAALLATLLTRNGGSQPAASAANDTNATTHAAVSASPPASKSASASASASPSGGMGVQVGDGHSGPTTLAGVLAAANSSVEGKGRLPAGKCDGYKQNAAGTIVCTAPVAGVSTIYYQNYSSLTALYQGYEKQVRDLDGGTFRQNTGTCGDGAVPYAEFGWNLEQGHPHNFTVAQMTAGSVDPLAASGRMACFAVHTAQGVQEDLVWTIDNAPALGFATGSPKAVYELWASLHHAVLFPGSQMCGTNGRMNLHDIPTGNLAVTPVCPPGVQGFTSPA